MTNSNTQNFMINNEDDFDQMDTVLELDDSGIWYGLDEFDLNNTSYDLKSDLLEVAQNYDEDLWANDVRSVLQDIKDHVLSEYSDFDQIKYIMCTNSNEYPTDEIHFNEYHDQEFYTLTFSMSNLVLILGR